MAANAQEITRDNALLELKKISEETADVEALNKLLKNESARKWLNEKDNLGNTHLFNALKTILLNSYDNGGKARPPFHSNASQIIENFKLYADVDLSGNIKDIEQIVNIFIENKAYLALNFKGFSELMKSNKGFVELLRNGDKEDQNIFKRFFKGVKWQAIVRNATDEGSNERPAALEILNMLNMLLEIGVPLGNFEEMRDNPLTIAIECKNKILIDNILSQKGAAALINRKDRSGLSPFIRAITTHNAGLVKRFVEEFKANPTEKEAAGYSAIDYSILEDQPEIFHFLLSLEAVKKTINEPSSFLLHLATRRPEYVSALLKNKVDVNIVDSYGNTALMNAVSRDNANETVDLLLNAGALLDPTDINGNNVLHCCFVLGSIYNPILNPEMATRLIKQAKRQDKDLLKAKNKFGMTPLLAAFDSLEQITIALNEREKRLNFRLDYKTIEEIQKRLTTFILEMLEDPVEPLAKTIRNDSLLTYALRIGNKEIIEKVLALPNVKEIINSRAAFERGDGKIVPHLVPPLESGQNLMQLTPLEFAAMKKDLLTVKRLIEMGADIESVDNENTGLIGRIIDFEDRAENKADKEELQKILNYIISKSKNLGGFDSKKYDKTLLLWAIGKNWTDIVKLLLERKEVIETINLRSGIDDKTALEIAIRNGNVEIVRELIKHKADFNPSTPKPLTILAIDYKNTEILKELCAAGVPLLAAGENEVDLLYRIINSKDATLMDFLLDQKELKPFLSQYNNKGETILTLSLSYIPTNVDLIKKILYLGVKTNIFSENQWTPLTLAARSNNREIIELILSQKETTETINVVNNNGMTALHYLIPDQYDLVKKLVNEYKANVEIIGNPKVNPLFSRALTYADSVLYGSKNDPAKVKVTMENLTFLIEKGANVQHVDKSNRTVLILAVIHGLKPLFDFLVSREDARKILNVQDEYGWAALHHACHKGRAEILDQLLKCGADVNLVDKLGRSALVLAIQGGMSTGDLNPINSLLSHPQISQIINRKYNYDKNIESSPLLMAIDLHDFKLMEILLRHGADVNLTYEKGHNLLCKVINNDHFPFSKKIIEFLKNNKINLFHEDENRENMLHWVARNPKIDLQLLIEGLSKQEILTLLRTKNKEGLSPLHIAAEKSPHFISNMMNLFPFTDEERIELLSSEAKNGSTPLSLAIVSGTLDDVKTAKLENLPHDLAQKIIAIPSQQGSLLEVAAKQQNSTQDRAAIFQYLLDSLKLESKDKVLYLTAPYFFGKYHSPSSADSDCTTRIITQQLGIPENLESKEEMLHLPQLAVIQEAIDILTLSDFTREFERSEIRRLTGSETAMDPIETETANQHFDSVIKPAFQKKFMSFGSSEEERINAIEREIRGSILGKIKQNLDKERSLLDERKNSGEIKKISEKISFIDDNLEKLKASEPKAMEVARGYFLSNIDTAEQAYRCYDPKAPIVAWENLFVLTENDGDIFSTRESSNERVTKGMATKIIRERAAYYYLCAMDESLPEGRDERLESLIASLAEIRRAHNLEGDDRINSDNPSCFPGHLTRLANSTLGHPDYKKPDAKTIRVLVQERMNAIIAKKFEETIKTMKDEQREELLRALTYLNESSSALIHLPATDIETGYPASLLKIRKDFQESLGKQEDLLKSVNEFINSKQGRNLSQFEFIYFEFAMHNIGGKSIARQLSDILAQVREASKPKDVVEIEKSRMKAQELEQKRLAELAPPFQLPLPSMLIKPEEMKKRIKIAQEKNRMFELLLPVLQDKIKGHELQTIRDITKEMVSCLFDIANQQPTLNTKERLAEVLMPKEGSFAFTQKKYPTLYAGSTLSSIVNVLQKMEAQSGLQSAPLEAPKTPTKEPKVEAPKAPTTSQQEPTTSVAAPQSSSITPGYTGVKDRVRAIEQKEGKEREIKKKEETKDKASTKIPPNKST